MSYEDPGEDFENFLDPMRNAPKSREVIEVLHDGEWIPAHWSDHADDGSYHGVPGWAQEDGGYVLIDCEGWRPIVDKELEPEDWSSPLPGHGYRQPVIVLGLGFGDEAKGATVDYLCSTIPDVSAVVRWSGGANAAHNVRHGVRHHTFRQFGSGTLLGIPTVLNRQVVVNPQILMAEAVELESNGVHSPLSLLIIDSQCKVVTPIMVAINRAREIIRGSARHGSCGLGIGETKVYNYANALGLNYLDTVGNFEVAGPVSHGKTLTMGDLSGFLSSSDTDLRDRVINCLKAEEIYAERILKEALGFAPFMANELDYGNIEEIADEFIELGSVISSSILSQDAFEDKLNDLMGSGTVIFEGSQGLLLDESWGFHPHTTWATINPRELIQDIERLNYSSPYVLGLTRSYMTRHGAGPLPSENTGFNADVNLPEDDNGWGRYQGSFRVGPLDLPLLSYSKGIFQRGIFSAKLDGIAISHMDLFGGDSSKEIPVIVDYNGVRNPALKWSIKHTLDVSFSTGNAIEWLNKSMVSSERTEVPMDSNTLIENVEDIFGAPVVILADGNTRRHRSYRAINAEKFTVDTEGAAADQIEEKMKLLKSTIVDEAWLGIDRRGSMNSSKDKFNYDLLKDGRLTSLLHDLMEDGKWK